MPTTTASLPAPERPRRRGFSLVELLLATSLSGIVLVAVLSSVLMISRSGYLLNNYMDMEAQARTALEKFALDARKASDVAWTSNTTTGALEGVTLVASDGSVTYHYDSAAKRLTRQDTLGTTTIITGIQTFTFTAYKYTYDTATNRPNIIAINPATTSAANLKSETKMVQISLSALRSRVTLANATNTVVSARFVLRNKRSTS